MEHFSISNIQADCIDELQEIIHTSCIQAGWFTDLKTNQPLDRNVPEMLALIHSEISEALEGYRKQLMDDHLPFRKGIEVELADAIIRILDLGGYLNLSIGSALQEKFAYNQLRLDHKVEHRKGKHGKSF